MSMKDRIALISTQFADKFKDPEVAKSIMFAGPDGHNWVSSIGIMKITDANLEEANLFLELLHISFVKKHELPVF